MSLLLNYIIDKISAANALHGKKLKKNIASFDSSYYERVNAFLSKYELMLQKNDKTIDFAIDCYLQMLADVNYETVQFVRTGRYSSHSFEDVRKKVYSNPEVMTYYMHGLMLSQFLWAHHYKILEAFIENLSRHHSNINNYLEIGGGHGLYLSEAIRILGPDKDYTLIDISPSSIEMTKEWLGNTNVNYLIQDVFDYNPKNKFDFISMGEVLEHVENPKALLIKVSSLLTENGYLWITTPTNAPAIDHIYLFRNTNDIHQVITEAGFDIIEKTTAYAEDVSDEVAEKFKVSMMYAALLKKH